MFFWKLVLAGNHRFCLPCASARSCTKHIMTHLKTVQGFSVSDRKVLWRRVRNSDFEMSSVTSDEHIARSAMRYMWSEMLFGERKSDVSKCLRVFLSSRCDPTFQEPGSWG